MEPAASDGQMLHARRICLALTAGAVVVPLISLAGWLAGIPMLASYGGRFIPMAPSTAIGFILLALPLLIALRPAQGLAASPGIGLAGGLAAAYGLLVALGWFMGLPVNPDDLLFKKMGTLGGHPVGRMSPATGLCFVLCGLSLIARLRGLSRQRAGSLYFSLAGLCGLAVFLAGSVFSLGYALGAPLLYGSRAIPMALPTAIGFLLLGGSLTGAAALCSPVSGRWYRTLNDMRIGLQLRLGLALILAFVVLIAALSWKATDLLWLQTKSLYDHPHQVRRAIGKLEVEIQSMSRYVRDLFLARSDQEIADALQGIAIKRIDAERRIATLYDRYLGPRDDVLALHDDYARWNALRDETVRLVWAGKTSEAEARIRPGGVQDSQAQAVRTRLRRIDDFAKNMGDQIYQDALRQKDTMNRNLAVIVAGILLLSLIVSYFLLKGIKDPLQQLTAAAEQFRRGKTEVRSAYVSANEFGLLSAAFNALADTVETQMRINEKAAQLAGVMLRETEAHAFCRELLKALVEHTGSQIGAIYLLNRHKTAFEHYESIGLGASGRVSFSAEAREGEFGAALATGRMQRITGIPEDTRFSFAAVSGEFKPREIITLPLMAGQEAVAVISLASISGYKKSAVRLLERIIGTLTARMNGVLAFRQIQELAQRLEFQNKELEAQKQELSAQAHQLTEMNAELEMQKTQLDEANRLKSAFLSKMSHELRTPLNSVIALSGVLNRRLAGAIPDEEFGYLEVIERNGKNLLSLINDILDLSRIEAGREEINLCQFSLRELVADIAGMLEPQAQQKGLTLLNQVGGDLPPVTSDPDKCRHILQNLVGNAVKFTEAGKVEISAWRMNTEIQVAVRDTGIGIAADHLPHIFDEFRQADDSASRKYGGSGLGLAIARRYADLLHGGIRVESTPGQGSTFTLSLPLALCLPVAGADAAMAPGSDFCPGAVRRCAAAGQGQRILLVEDSEPAVIQMTDFLTGQGYAVQVARNGHEALAQVEKSLPDGVILDLMMPGMDGFAVLRQIRSTEKSAHLPVLILTAKRVTREELSFLRGNRIHQLIQKGDVSRAELLAAVARMVAPPEEKPAPAERPNLKRGVL